MNGTTTSSVLVFFVNGKKVVDENPDPELTLLTYLRKKLKLCGTKLGCAEGGCGACTVMLSKYDRQQDKIVHLAINACLAPICAMHGMAITTVEGIGSTKNRLHPVQERIAKAHGSQCGFCTPGIVMSMYALLRNMAKPSYKDLEVAFQGNLCRCTGYRPIIEGYRTFTEEWEQQRMVTQNGTNGVCGMGKDCCKNKKSNGETVEETDEPLVFDQSQFTPYDPSQEPIFPPELKVSSNLDDEELIFKGKSVTWYRPTSLSRLLELKNLYPNAKIVNGNTEVGVEVKFKNFLYPVIIVPSHIKELLEIKLTENGLLVGAAVTLSNMETALKTLIETQPSYKTAIFKQIVDMLHWFAGKQIRNVSAVGGNIMTSSPISDLNPIFLAANTSLQLQSVDGIRGVNMDGSFFTGYRKNIVKNNEILRSLIIPFTSEYQVFKAYKQAKRRDDDIAIVNMALNVKFEKDTGKVSNIQLTFGGMSHITVLAQKTCDLIKGSFWNENIIDVVYKSLLDELPLSPSAPGGMVPYRRSLTLSLFFKGFLEIANDLQNKLPNIYKLDDREKSAIDGFGHNVLKSSQYFSISKTMQTETTHVGRPIVHSSAFKQATGEAIYCDDMPLMEDELYLAFVLSTKAHANIISVDPSAALAMDGVVAFFSAADISKNYMGPLVHDEEIFYSKKVTSQGQSIGAIIAINQTIAQKAAKAVKVTYEELTPIIVTIEDAIQHKSFFSGYPKVIKQGNVEDAFKKCDFVVEKEVRTGGQEHFYLETHCSRVVPKKEDDELEVISSSQHPTEIAKYVAHMLDLPINKVVTKVKRMGGGFGGKESRGLLVSLPVAFAAHKLQKPVRCMLDRDEDMLMTGGRNPFLFKYKIGFMKSGKIVAARIEMYINSGYSLDLTPAVLERAMLHCENTYNIPNIEVIGYVCKTNITSNTAFRGFGGPQAMLLAENYIRDVALKVNKPVEEVMDINMYNEGESTHFNQVLTNCTVKRCFDECKIKANYIERKKQVEEFNKKNQWKKRGITIVPTKFGCAFSIKFLNQGGALVHVYTDGSVLLSHGGTEMGQGLHTKMIQIAADVFGIDTSKIHISETSTDKVPNTSPTAASVSSDINGMAVFKACKTIMDRLKPIIEANPKGTWEQWIMKAYLECIGLSAVGYYATEGIGYNLDTNTGNPFNYYSYGACVAEVEIDCLTGDHQVIRSDIVMDVGDSLNPAIDIGQIEGAFMQGYGLFTIEELIYSPTGTLYSRGPGAYKIPGFTDIPAEFNVSLLKGAPNPRAIYSSKAVGEPPLFLASSVFFAIKEAIRASRLEYGEDPDFSLDAPATASRIRTACSDVIMNKITKIQTSPGTPWNVVL